MNWKLVSLGSLFTLALVGCGDSSKPAAAPTPPPVAASAPVAATTSKSVPASAPVASTASVAAPEAKAATVPESALQNLAAKKTATSSTTEDGHDAAFGNDGDPETRWCAVDGTTPQWWMVDLGEGAKEVRGVDIQWEMEKVYQFTLEGSTDGTKWTVLSEQKNNDKSVQEQKLRFAPANVRYVRLTVTGLEEGSWASFFELRVMGVKK